MKIMAYASRPLPDFNKYEALDMLESLQLTAQDTKHDRQNFYRLVYQTVRGKLDVPRDQFRSLVLRLLGDKDHEKIFDCVAKVEKHYRSRDRPGPQLCLPITGKVGREMSEISRETREGLCRVSTVEDLAILNDSARQEKGIFLGTWGCRRMARLQRQLQNKV